MPILKKIRELWDAQPSRRDYVMPWGATTLCFIGFFQSGKITVPARDTFNARTHPSWVDVASDNPENPQAIRVHLRHSKTDQFGRGTEVIMGRTAWRPSLPSDGGGCIYESERHLAEALAFSFSMTARL